MPPGMAPAVCLWLECRPMANGGLRLKIGDLLSQMKFNSITRADVIEAMKLAVAFFLSCCASAATDKQAAASITMTGTTILFFISSPPCAQSRALWLQAR